MYNQNDDDDRVYKKNESGKEAIGDILHQGMNLSVLNVHAQKTELFTSFWF